MKEFIDALRDRMPKDDLPPGHVKVLHAINGAFQDVEKKDIQVVDQELRAFVMKAMK